MAQTTGKSVQSDLQFPLPDNSGGVANSRLLDTINCPDDLAVWVKVVSIFNIPGQRMSGLPPVSNMFAIFKYKSWGLMEDCDWKNHNPNSHADLMRGCLSSTQTCVQFLLTCTQFSFLSCKPNLEMFTHHRQLIMSLIIISMMIVSWAFSDCSLKQPSQSWWTFPVLRAMKPLCAQFHASPVHSNSLWLWAPLKNETWWTPTTLCLRTFQNY